MQILTREGMFETNSSSTHCLVTSHLVEEDLMDTLSSDLILNPVDGCNYDSFHTAREKLAYYMTYAVMERQSIDLVEKIRSVVREHSGLEFEFVDDKSDSEYGWYWEDRNCYDEYSSESPSDPLYGKNPDKLRDVIFNRKYVIRIEKD